ncbi:MAG: Holliday junction branch migration protein RuvA [Gammaproteobacteria bacterium]|nr:Holliday junction branch migration protein RuvA [Gammaproteobacteria bacterium]
MIGRITGVLLEKDNQLALIDVGGIGYEVEVPLNTFFKLPKPGETLTLHTHFVVREDAQLLYGFIEEIERALFRVLIRINGVGPKMAIAMLSGMEVSEFISCVQRDDVNALVKMPGVGKKTAERLIIELKDKVSNWQEPVTMGTSATVSKGSSLEEAENALISLGYKPQEAGRAVIAAAKILEENSQVPDSESLIRTALKNVS